MVRSRSLVGNFAGASSDFVWRKHHHYTNLCERTRTESYQTTCAHAEANGANAVIMDGATTRRTKIFNGVTEVICYGSGAGSSSKGRTR